MERIYYNVGEYLGMARHTQKKVLSKNLVEVLFKHLDNVLEFKIQYRGDKAIILVPSLLTPFKKPKDKNKNACTIWYTEEGIKIVVNPSEEPFKIRNAEELIDLIKIVQDRKIYLKEIFVKKFENVKA